VFNVARNEWGIESLSNPVELVRKPQPNNARTRRIAFVEPGGGPLDAGDPESDRGTQDSELERVVAASSALHCFLPSFRWPSKRPCAGEKSCRCNGSTWISSAESRIYQQQKMGMYATYRCRLGPSRYCRPCDEAEDAFKVAPKMTLWATRKGVCSKFVATPSLGLRARCSSLAEALPRRVQRSRAAAGWKVFDRPPFP